MWTFWYLVIHLNMSLNFSLYRCSLSGLLLSTNLQELHTLDISVCKLLGSTNKQRHRQHNHRSLIDTKMSLISQRLLQDQALTGTMYGILSASPSPLLFCSPVLWAERTCMIHDCGERGGVWSGVFFAVMQVLPYFAQSRLTEV